MENEIKNIVQSEKNKYLKTVAIIYLVLGILILLASLIYSILEANLIVFIVGFLAFATIFFFYILNIILYEIHQMNRYLLKDMVKENIEKQNKIKEIAKTEEKNNEEELNNLLKKLEEDN